jgi:outer membrane protein TolC
MRSIITCIALIALTITVVPEGHAQPKRKAAAATKADVQRLEQRIEDQQKQIDKLLKAQQQYLNALRSMFGDTGVSQTEPKVDEPKVVA